MKNNTKISLALMGVLVFQFVIGGIAHASVYINGTEYSDAWIRDPANHDTVVKFVSENPGTAASLLQTNPSALQAVCDAYNKTLGECQQIVNETVTTTKPVDAVVVGNQVYSNAWIEQNQAAVVNYLTGHTNEAATILQNASQATKDAVLKAVNTGKTGTDVITAAQAATWIKDNANVEMTQTWLKANPGTSDPWAHNGGVNDAQVKEWLAQNKKLGKALTAAQIVDTMAKFQIDLNQMARVSGVGAQELMKMANTGGITNENLAQKGLLGSMGLATTMNNVWWAIQAGSMNKGVYCALYVIDQGKVNPDCREYSQKDMNTALSYQKNGYWGPSGTGDPFTELKNAGLIKGVSYVGPNTWGGGGSSASGSTGPNIAGTNYATTGLSVTNAGTLPVYTSTTYALGPNNYADIYDKIRNDNLTIGTRIGDTVTVTNQQVKDFFAANPSAADLIKFAAENKMTSSNVAQALTIGKGVPYDPAAAANYIRDFPGYALGPDNIIVKLQPGQTKRASDGLLEGTWSSDPGHVSYTDWARAWYCAGNGNVKTGADAWKIDYGHGLVAAQCDAGTTPTSGATSTTTSVTTATNPYAAYFSAGNINILNGWVNRNIIAKKSTLSNAEYTSFVNRIVEKINTVKARPNTDKTMNMLNYLLIEITK